jgi:lipoprotein-anchoring transpeptidase ErfK/SrfK
VSEALRRKSGLAAALVLAAVLAVSAAIAIIAASPSSGSGRPQSTATRVGGSGQAGPKTALPAPVRPAFKPPKPVFLSGSETTARWAVVRSAVAARAEPAMAGRVVTRLDPQTPEGTSNIVLALGSKADARGRLWIHVRLPVLPNNATGWVPRSALGGYGIVHTRLVINLRTFTATLLRDGRPVFRAEVGVGKAAWPTPKGEFYIRNRLTGFGDPVYGPLAFGTSARSSVLTDWPAGGFVGIHGTNQPELLPGRVSHGCIRLRNADILELDRLMPVGTPLTIL